MVTRDVAEPTAALVLRDGAADELTATAAPTTLHGGPLTHVQMTVHLPRHNERGTAVALDWSLLALSVVRANVALSEVLVAVRALQVVDGTDALVVVDTSALEEVLAVETLEHGFGALGQVFLQPLTLCDAVAAVVGAADSHKAAHVEMLLHVAALHHGAAAEYRALDLALCAHCFMWLNVLLHDWLMAVHAFNLLVLTRVNVGLEVFAYSDKSTVPVAALEHHVLAVFFVLRDLCPGGPRRAVLGVTFDRQFADESSNGFVAVPSHVLASAYRTRV